MNKELISIIVPVYNCEKYLKECLESILKQSYINFELILINDGSKDDSGKICEEYAMNDDRIIYINQLNSGVSAARRKGIDISNGKYISFIDSDDYIDKDYLLNLYNKINESESEFICCNSIDIEVLNYENNKIIKEEIIMNKERLFQDYFQGKRYAYCIWGKLYKREALINIEFKNIKYGEDTCMIIELFDKCEKVHVLNYDGYYYRGQENSVSNTIKQIEKYNDLLVQTELIYKICEEKLPNLLKKASKNFIDNLYRAMVAYFRNEEIYLNNNFLVKYKQYYDELPKKYLYGNLKGIIIIMFNLNNNLGEKILKTIYRK